MRERHARRALALAAATVAAGQVATSLLLDGPLYPLRFPEATAIAAGAAGRQVDVAVLGSSRFDTLVHVAEISATLGGGPHVLKAVVAAGDPIAQERVLEELLQRGVRPRALVAEVSPDLLGRPSPWLTAHLTRQLRLVDLPAFLPELFRARSRLLSTRLVPVHTFRAELLAPVGLGPLAEEPSPSPGAPRAPGSPLIAPPELGCDADVWIPTTAAEVAEHEAKARRVTAIRRRFFTPYAADGAASLALDRMLDRAAAGKMSVFLVVTPFRSIYRGLFTPEVDAVFQARLQELAGGRARVVDYRDRLPDVLLNDESHGRHAGGRLFSRLLAREVIGPWWTANGGEVRARPCPPS
jgi:hypothetical protein